MTETRNTKEPRREGRQRHPPCDPQTVFGRREDPNRAGRPEWRGWHCGAVPPRGYCAGGSLISTDRLRRSRNEKLAEVMRSFGLCEERGGGLDKTVLEIEQMNLPAPLFISSEQSMKVVLFGPKAFSKMSKADKMRACFFHCVSGWLQHDYIGNASLRERFGLEDESYQAVSEIITERLRDNRIAPADKNLGKRNARYVPYCAA